MNKEHPPPKSRQMLPGSNKEWQSKKDEDPKPLIEEHEIMPTRSIRLFKPDFDKS
jgi:hypothetical protein